MLAAPARCGPTPACDCLRDVALAAAGTLVNFGRGRDAEPQPGSHARRVRLDRRVEEAAVAGQRAAVLARQRRRQADVDVDGPAGL